MNIVILGPQGSGKGTQAELLAKEYDLEHIDIGSALRQVAKMPTPLGKKIYAIQNISRGLVPDSLLRKVLRLKLTSINRKKGLIIDGLPRTTKQAFFLEEEMKSAGRRLDKVIYLKLSEKESLKRIALRWNCSKCKSILIFGKDIKKKTDACPKCGGKIFQRKDDSEEGVKKRLEIFRKETLPVVEYFRDKGILLEIDGKKTIKKVFQDITKAIGKGV